MIQEIERVDRGDVYIEPIKPTDCDNCTKNPATERVFVDLRELGMSTVVGLYCSICAPMMANRLKDALPPEF